MAKPPSHRQSSCTHSDHGYDRRMRARLIDASGQHDFPAGQAIAPPPSFGWVDIRVEGDDTAEVAKALTALGFDRIMMSYSLRTGVAGMFQGYRDFIVGVTWFGTTSPSQPAEVHFAWNPKYLVTVRFGGDEATAAVIQRLRMRETSVFEEPAVFLGLVLEFILAGVDESLTVLAEDIGSTDAAIIESVSPAQLGQLRALRAEIGPLSRRFPTYSDAVSAACFDPASLPGLDDPGTHYLQSYANRVSDTSGRIQDLVSAIRDAAQDYQTEMGNRQGNRINQLTIVSVVFLPISFLTGYFGMNFQWLDNGITSFWTWMLLGVILPIVTVIVSIAILARLGYILRVGSKKADEEIHQRVASKRGGSED